LKEIRRKTKKPENIWFRVFYFLSSFIVWISLRLRVTPNQLTITGFVLNLIAFIFFMGSKSGPMQVFISGAVFTMAHIFDCADGHLAHVANLRSERGYWLDSAFDTFKISFIVTCFIKMIVATSLPHAVSYGILNTIGLAAALGVLVDYAVSLNALIYLKPGDPYVATQISSIASARLFIVRVLLSIVREYGNLLLIFVLFGINQNVAVVLFAGFGICHFILAFARVVRIARLI
jgi:phosphatidylglycerophosphate synthase